MIQASNEQNARTHSRCFEQSGCAVRFDGSQLDGRRAIESSLAAIFKDHPTARYVTIVREVRTLGDEVVLLRAVAGMVPRNASNIKPELNAIQPLIVRFSAGEWKVALFQNTPAAFHGRPEVTEALTQELQKFYDQQARNK